MSPLYMKFGLHDTTVEVVPGALDRFKKLKGQRALVCPNHSNRHDPQVMFMFSKFAGEQFNFVAAREVFDFDRGMNGWWLQHLGTYSVVRGAPDRESFKMTKKIICEGKKKLVLFPEGEISNQNDTLMPLETGAAQLSYWALDELNKTDQTSPIYIIPMALKYTYTHNIKATLRQSLDELDSRLGLKSNGSAGMYERLLDTSRALLHELEQEYNLKPAADASLNDRINNLRMAVLGRLGGYFKVDLGKEKQLDLVRTFRNKIDDCIFEEEDGMSDYAKTVHDERSRTLKSFYRDLDRVVNFVAIYDGYTKEHMTQERFADVVGRLEHEIIGGEPSFKGPRRVLVDVGQPINLRDHHPDYKANKKQCLANITNDIFQQISNMLQKLEDSRKHIYLD